MAAIGAIITIFSLKAGQMASRSRLVQDARQLPPKRDGPAQSGMVGECEVPA